MKEARRGTKDKPENKQTNEIPRQLLTEEDPKLI